MMFPAREFTLDVIAECGSTNELLLSRRDQDGFAGTALLALSQTAGQGRRGREWRSPEGNLALSVAFRESESSRAPLYSFLIGLAAYRVLVDLLPHGLDLRLKWPNDIYLCGKKLAGILAQARQQGLATDLVVGIGLNLARAPQGMEPEAVSVSEFVGPPRPETFAKSFLAELVHLTREIQNFEDLRRIWEEAAHLSGTELTIQGEEGSWKAIALLPSGELEVAGEHGARRKLSSETVSVRFVKKS